MNFLDKINYALLNAMQTSSTLAAGDEGLAKLETAIRTALNSVISVMYAVGVVILGKRLIQSIILSKKSEDPDEEVAKYKKEISNTVIALIIITVVYVGLEVLSNTVILAWIKSIFDK